MSKVQRLLHRSTLGLRLSKKEKERLSGKICPLSTSKLRDFEASLVPEGPVKTRDEVFSNGLDLGYIFASWSFRHRI